MVLGDIKPVSPGRLDNLTEVVIKPPGEKASSVLNDKKTNEFNNKTKLNFLTQTDVENLILRVAPFKELTSHIQDLACSFNVFVLRKNIKDTIQTPKLFLMKLISNDDVEKSVYVRLYVFEDVLNGFKADKISSENIFVSDVIFNHFRCELGARVVLEPYKNEFPQVNEIEIYTKRDYSIDVIQNFQKYLADNCKKHEFVLNSNVVLENVNNLKCFLRFQPCQAKFCVVTQDFVRDCKLIFVNETIPKEENFIENVSEDEYCTDLTNYKEIIDNSIFLFTYNTRSFTKMENILITGDHFSFSQLC